MHKNETVIRLDDVSVKYRLSKERPYTLQEYLIHLLKGKKTNYEDFWALRSVTFKVIKGENIGIIGNNGAGKSTLLKVIAGVIKPTSGAVNVNGMIAPLIELGAGFDMELTAEENIYLNASILGLTKKEVNAKLQGIIEFSELKDFLYSPLRAFSSGMVARLAFSIAVEVNADILIVDEVLSVGDEGFKKKCHNRIDDLLTSDLTLLFVSHNIAEVQRLCHSAVWLERGQVASEGDSELVSRRYIFHFDKTAFEDIPQTHPYKQYIDTMFMHGITNGYQIGDKRYYNPENKISRGEMAVFLARAMGMEKTHPKKNIFADVSETYWAAQHISWLYEQGLIEGLKDKAGTSYFNPDDYITVHDLGGVLSRMNKEKSEHLMPEAHKSINRGEFARILCDFFDLL